jgi:2-haloacid dehalogenase
MSDFAAEGIRIIACDIFGTTVDWYSGVRDQVADVFGEHGVRLDAGEFTSAWRGRYLPSMRRVQDGEREWAYLDTLHRESLDTLLEEHGVSLDQDARARLVRAWHRLPAWPDAAGDLARLRSRYVVAALSNGGFALMTNLIKSASLPFDCVLSAELARTYKPAPEVYRTAAGLLDVAPHEMLMVAAHGWDLDGARAAGLRTAFLVRPREKGPHQEADRDVEADLSVTSFGELAERLM